MPLNKLQQWLSSWQRRGQRRQAETQASLFTRSICLLCRFWLGLDWIELLTSRLRDLRVRFAHATRFSRFSHFSLVRLRALGSLTRPISYRSPDTLICGQSKYQISMINLASRSIAVHSFGSARL